MVYRSAEKTLPKLSVQALCHIVQEEAAPKHDYFIAMEKKPLPPLPPRAAPVPFSPLFSSMSYDPPPPTPTESSRIFSSLQHDTSQPMLTGSLSMQHNQQPPTAILHVPQTMMYEQFSAGPPVGRYRAKFQISPPGLTRQNGEFITDMINAEGPLPSNSSLALANTKAATYFTLVTAHAATIDFGGYWPTELKHKFEIAIWHKVGRFTSCGRCFDELVEINGGRTFHCWVERVPEDPRPVSRCEENAGVGAGRTWRYF